MIELRVGPYDGVVTLLTGRREARVIDRGLGIVVVRLVARDAGRDRDAVVVIDMAAGAGRRQVRAGQRPSRRRVVEFAIGPKNGIVALFAGCRQRQANVIKRRLRVVVIGLVARNAARDRNLIVIVDVTQSTSRRYVRASQREAGLRVIKGRWLPGCRVVADIASLRKIAAHVVRIFSAIEVVDMARNAARDSNVVVIVDMAAGARRS